MKIFTSAWVMPISAPPIERGAIVVESGEIVAVGPRAEVLARFGDAAARSAKPSVRLPGPPPDRPARADAADAIHDLGDAIVIPAFVNAHTHLELSWMRQSPPPRGDFMAWVRTLIERVAPPDEIVRREVRDAIAEARMGGTALVGDVGNSVQAIDPLLASGMGGVFFYELLGGWEAGPHLRQAVAEHGKTGREEDAKRPVASQPDAAQGDERIEAAEHEIEDALRQYDRRPPAPRTFAEGQRPDRTETSCFATSVSPHSAMAVSPGLLRAIADRARRRSSRLSVHLAESRAEVELLTCGSGPFRPLLDVRSPSWSPPGLTPAQVLDEAGILSDRTLAVHAVHVTDEDIRLLRARGATIVLCPRSNAWIDVGTAPVDRFLREDVRLALGTDSLASNDDLDMLSELAAARRMSRSAPPAWALHAATLGGARALGMDDRYGSIEPGKRAALVVLTRKAAEARDPHLRHASLSGGTTDRPGTPIPGAGQAGEDPEPYATIYAGREFVDLLALS